MFEPLSYLTFWQVAVKWAEELKLPVMDVIQVMKGHATYSYPFDCFSEEQHDPLESRPQPHRDCPTPPLVIYPTLFFNSQGELNSATAFNATRMVQIDPRNGIGIQNKFRAKYRTHEYLAAEAFLNSAECPPEPTEEVKKHLSHFSIKKEGFETYCKAKGHPLPKFWFPSIPRGNESETIQETPEKYIDRRRGEGACKELIAVELQKSFNMTFLHIGRHLDHDGLHARQYKAIKKRGQRLVQKGKEMLENVTPSRSDVT